MNEPTLCKTHGIPKDVQLDCSRCGGSGEIEDDDPAFVRRRMVRCYACGGSGLEPWPECEICLDEEYE